MWSSSTLLPTCPRRFGILADLQLVALLQGAAFVAAEADQGVRRAAVHEDGDVYAAGHGQVGPGAVLEVVEGEHVPLPHLQRLPRRSLLAVYLRRHLGSCYGDDGGFGELQLGAEVGDLQPRRAFFVAHQVVADLVGEDVHRPRGRHPEGVLPEAARVLDGGEETRLPHPNRHRAPPGSPRCRRAGPRARGRGGRRTPSCVLEGALLDLGLEPVVLLAVYAPVVPDVAGFREDYGVLEVLQALLHVEHGDRGAAEELVAARPFDRVDHREAAPKPKARSGV